MTDEREPTRCYAVVSGAYSDYRVHAVYRRREAAEARCRASNQAREYLVDGVPADWGEVEAAQVAALGPWTGGYLSADNHDAYRAWHRRAYDWRREHVTDNPAREVEDALRVEEFDYYEGEPLPAEVQE